MKLSTFYTCLIRFIFHNSLCGTIRLSPLSLSLCSTPIFRLKCTHETWTSTLWSDYNSVTVLPTLLHAFMILIGNSILDVKGKNIKPLVGKWCLKTRNTSDWSPRSPYMWTNQIPSIFYVTKLETACGVWKFSQSIPIFNWILISKKETLFFEPNPNFCASNANRQWMLTNESSALTPITNDFGEEKYQILLKNTLHDGTRVCVCVLGMIPCLINISKEMKNKT